MNNEVKTILPIELNKRLESQEKVVIIDVREPEEWVSGHIPNAKHIPLGSIQNRLVEIDPNTETVVVCRSGNRSGQACEFLAEKGYKAVNMVGGMMQWPGEVERGS